MPTAVPHIDARPSPFLPHVQGLRAIAVLAVVVFHVWPDALPGGFSGVDIFFVISGLLITGHLAREIAATGTVHLAAFWARRARRLLPAALLVLVVCALLAASPWFLPVSAVPSRIKELLASTFYVENWYLVWTSANYLGHSGDPSLSQHYWSLSVEEQFYLIWPLLLLAAVVLARRFARDARRALVVTVLLMTVLGFAVCVWFTAVEPAAAYFATFTRVWEFGVGGLLALCPAPRFDRAGWRSALAWIGIGGLLASFVVLNGSLHFPGWFALLPVGATALIIASGPEGRRWSANRVIALPPFAFVGRISYSLYLWHWPVLLLAPALPFWTGGFAQRTALVVVCVGLAWLTQSFVETPMRSLPALARHRPRRTLWATAAAMAIATALILAAGVATVPRYTAARQQIEMAHSAPAACFGAASVLDSMCASVDFPSVVPTADGAGMDAPSARTCLVQYTDAEVNPCSFGSTAADAPEVFLIGDSHAFQYVDAFAAIAREKGWKLTTLLKGGCPWNATPLADDGPSGAACSAWHTQVNDLLARRTPALVVTTAFWGTMYAAHGALSSADAEAQGFRAAWAPVVSRNVPIVAIVDNPSFEANPNVCLLNRSPDDCRIDRATALPRTDPFSVAAGGSASVHIADFTDVYCDATACSPVIGGAGAYRDPDHLTASFAASLIPWLTSACDEALAAG